MRHNDYDRSPLYCAYPAEKIYLNQDHREDKIYVLSFILDLRFK